MITGYIPRECQYCICRLCGQAACPHRPRPIKRCNLCWSAHELRPIHDCRNFYFKWYHRYTVVRRYKSPRIRYVDKTNADDLRVMLTEILQLLRTGDQIVRSDVNCVRHNCLCIRCDYFSSCSDRCKLCINFRGEHPISMCAVKVLRDKPGCFPKSST